MEYTTPGGVLVTDRRHSRAGEFPQIDPREHDPNPNPASSVGPDTLPGDEIMGPGPRVWHAEAWDGWPSDWQTPYMSGAGSGWNPLEAMVGRTSTAMTCVDLNSRQLASFPRYGLRGTEPIRLPTWATNPEPSIYGSWSDFMHATVNSLELRGEAFQYVTGRFADGYPARFITLNPDVVQVELIDGALEYLVDTAPVDRRDVFHLKYQSMAGSLRGIGPLEWSARSLLTAASLERYAMNLSSRGGIPWGVLKANRNIDANQAAEVQARWVAASRRRDGGPAVIGNAFDLQTLSFSPEQMALLGLREFDERRICAAFGVPAFLVNVSMAGSLTYSNVTGLFLHHYQSTLRPLAQMIAEAWSEWLLPYGTIMEFSADRYVQPEFEARTRGYQTMFNIADPVTGRRAMEVDEIRAAERLPPSGAPANLESAQQLTGRGV
jgi:HK97 family phage portal protein